MNLPPRETMLQAMQGRRCKPLHTGDGDPDWLPRLMEAVDADPAKRWQDQDIRHLDIDPSTVRRWFITHHGLSLHAYSRLRRLGTALRQMWPWAGVACTASRNVPLEQIKAFILGTADAMRPK